MLSKNYAQEGRVDIKPPTGLVRVENGNRGHNRLGVGLIWGVRGVRLVLLLFLFMLTIVILRSKVFLFPNFVSKRRKKAMKSEPENSVTRIWAINVTQLFRTLPKK